MGLAASPALCFIIAVHIPQWTEKRTGGQRIRGSISERSIGVGSPRSAPKAANLGELSRIAGVDVPPGACVTTHAFRRAVRGAPQLVALLDRLTARDPDDRDGIAASSAELREAVGRVPVPDDVADAVARTLAPDTAYAVRSSATAEDLPTASFAGQQDSHLGIVGAAAVLEHLRRCWASLFTERAVAYRLRHGVDHRTVAMAVVIQELVAPDASGCCSPPTR